TTKKYAELVTSIKKVLPNASIGADVITGFPGETEEDFKETYEFIKSLPITYLHVFTYSDRKGTRASVMKEKIPEGVKRERTKRLRELSTEKRVEFLKENLFLEFNLKKCYIRPLSYGIDFIGYFVKPWRTYVRRRVAKAFKNKLWVFEKYGELDGNKDKMKNSIASYFGHFKHAKALHFLEKIKEKHPWIKESNPRAFFVSF
ncbi:MAG: hypothetical protein D4Q79_02385, partial [Spirochaetia bacterium]